MSHARSLKRAMKAANLDEHQLAESSGVDITLIGRYLRGEVDIGIKNAPRLAKALHCEPGDLLFGKRAA